MSGSCLALGRTGSRCLQQFLRETICMAATLQLKSMGCPLGLLLQAGVQSCSDTCVRNASSLHLPPAPRGGLPHKQEVGLTTHSYNLPQEMGQMNLKAHLFSFLNMQLGTTLQWCQVTLQPSRSMPQRHNRDTILHTYDRLRTHS